jgi:hypothetical protein
MWRDAERICMTPLPVETITCPITGKKVANNSDESWWYTNTVYNVGNFGLLKQYLGRLSTATRRVSVTDWWCKFYEVLSGSKIFQENSVRILLLSVKNVRWYSTLNGQQSYYLLNRSLLRFSKRKSAIMKHCLWSSIYYFLQRICKLGLWCTSKLRLVMSNCLFTVTFRLTAQLLPDLCKTRLTYIRL